MLKMSGTIIMQTVPALLPVEARKTCDYQCVSGRKKTFERCGGSYVDEWEGPLRRENSFEVRDAEALWIYQLSSGEVQVQLRG
jgi:hypothetical protein